MKRKTEPSFRKELERAILEVLRKGRKMRFLELEDAIVNILPRAADPTVQIKTGNNTSKLRNTLAWAKIALHKPGLIEYPTKGMVRITPEGIKALNSINAQRGKSVKPEKTAVEKAEPATDPLQACIESMLVDNRGRALLALASAVFTNSETPAVPLPSIPLPTLPVSPETPAAPEPLLPAPVPVIQVEEPNIDISKENPPIGRKPIEWKRSRKPKVKIEKPVENVRIRLEQLSDEILNRKAKGEIPRELRINDVLKARYAAEGHTDLRTVLQWLDAGKEIKHGEKTLPIWKKTARNHFIPVCLFSQKQVQPTPKHAHPEQKT